METTPIQRVNDTITGRIERPLLQWLCRRMPPWVTSDMLTALGVAGAALACAGYALSNWGKAYLWLACAGIALNWFGDSLDGTLARHHAAERPRYGFFLDLMTDSFAMALIAIGIGLTPYAALACGMAVLLAYYLMVILSLATSRATGIYQIAYNGIGPTEIRLFIVFCTITGILFPIPSVDWAGVRLTIYDGVMIVIAILLAATAFAHSVKTARKLAVEDPPRR